MREISVLAKYPFLTDAKHYIKAYGPSVQELLENILYERARTIGVERLENTLKQKDAGNRSLATESDCIMEILSYPIARMIAVCVGDLYFQKRYALGEAFHAYNNLLHESTPFLINAAVELGMSISYEEETNHLAVFFKDYLRFAPTRYKEWKMVNRTMKQGYVQISRKDLTRILMELLRKRINEELENRNCNKLILQTFSEEIARFQNTAAMQRKKMDAAPVGKLDIEKLPPCLTDILAMIQAGENVPHMGRFALVAFLSSLKLSTNDIIKLFSSAPDFEEDKSRYQIEHIAGKGSSTNYKSPGCEKMRTFGICPVDKMDALCKKIHHPVSYYQAKWRKEKKQK